MGRGLANLGLSLLLATALAIAAAAPLRAGEPPPSEPAQPQSAEASSPSREYQAKAALIYNFVQFVEWPARAFPQTDSPLIIAIVGSDPFDGALERAVRDKSVNGHHLLVKWFDSPDQIAEPCHVLFVSSSENQRLERVFQRLDRLSVLTIGESQEFPWAGGAIRLLGADSRVRFEVNLEATERAKLRISSKLLKLARIFRK